MKKKIVFWEAQRASSLFPTNELLSDEPLRAKTKLSQLVTKNAENSHTKYPALKSENFSLVFASWDAEARSHK